MSALPLPSAATNVWPRMPGSTTGPMMSAPVPLGGGSGGLPTVNNPNLPLSTLLNTNNPPPPVPQAPFTPFPAIRPPFGGTNTVSTNNYAVPTTFPAFNPVPTNLVPNPFQTLQYEANNRRLAQLEDENTQRRNTTFTLQQMGTNLLQGQMDVQEQILQYQFMLEQCMETLDHQNFILNGQAEELALLRAKIRHFEHFMDSIKQTKESNQLGLGAAAESNFLNGELLCSRMLARSLQAPAGSPFFPGGVTRVTSSKFQPFNPRYRSPTNRNEPRSMTPSIPNPPATNTRLARPFSNSNN